MEEETKTLQAAPIKEKTEALCDAIPDQGNVTDADGKNGCVYYTKASQK